jgi:hypothetical protein
MKKVLPWIMVLLVITVVFGTIYVAVQQSQRNEANWPQIQLSEDMAAKLDDKADPTVLMGDQVNVLKSLKPFTVIFDKQGKPVAASGFIKDKLPTINKAVLDSSKGKDYSAVTWRPSKDVRLAAVTVEAKNYYVLSARSLKEVEKNQNTTLLLSLLGWLVSVLLLGGLFAANGRGDD